MVKDGFADRDGWRVGTVVENVVEQEKTMLRTDDFDIRSGVINADDAIGPIKMTGGTGSICNVQ